MSYQKRLLIFFWLAQSYANPVLDSASYSKPVLDSETEPQMWAADCTQPEVLGKVRLETVMTPLPEKVLEKKNSSYFVVRKQKYEEVKAMKISVHEIKELYFCGWSDHQTKVYPTGYKNVVLDQYQLKEIHRTMTLKHQITENGANFDEVEFKLHRSMEPIEKRVHLTGSKAFTDGDDDVDCEGVQVKVK